MKKGYAKVTSLQSTASFQDLALLIDIRLIPHRSSTGLKPLSRNSHHIDNLPEPTSHLQARSHPLNLDKDVGKTLMVDNSQDSRRGAGYYCEMCRKTFKDSIGYLDHINGRGHLRRLGQTQFVEKSSVEAVRKRIAMLLEKKKIAKESGGAQEYDFMKRVEALKEEERRVQEEKKRRKKEEKKRKRGEEPIATAEEGGGADDEMMKMMGFGGFGSRKK